MSRRLLASLKCVLPDREQSYEARSPFSFFIVQEIVSAAKLRSGWLKTTSATTAIDQARRQGYE